eukprot:1189068-Prorocentrum_minimum.AAC.3
MLVRILQACDAFVTENPPKLSPGVKQLIETLHAKGKDVYLVSGGFRQMINPVASALNIPRENISANTLLFNDRCRPITSTPPRTQTGM